VVIRALLVVTLVLCVLFVWRAWNRHPAPAALAAAAAAGLGIVLFQHPVLAAVGLAVIFSLIVLLSLRKK
jgi:hypothetical protein